MVIIRDETRVQRLKRIATALILISMAVLLAGALITLTDNVEYFFISLIALPAGFLMSQAAMYLTHRYVRQPRPDQSLDDALKKVAKGSRIYHYVLTAPHVLLTPAGIIILIAKYQRGEITYDNGRWRQKGIGFLSRSIGQESIGDPVREAELEIKALAKFISHNAPEVQEIPIGALIVFTTKAKERLNVKHSPIPTMHVSKLKGYFKQQTQKQTLSVADFDALQRAFDKKAAKILG